MSQPFIKEKDISIDKSFDCFQILYEWKCMPSCGYAIGGSAQENERAKSGFIVPVLLDFTHKGIILACADDILISLLH